MNIFRREHSNHLVPIHPDNAVSKDWIILLEASTIVGPASERLRVARTTQERKIIKRFKGFRRRLFLFVDGLDPRIHTLYFCPQLYKYDGNDKLVPLQGEEIGELIAEQLQDKLRLGVRGTSHRKNFQMNQSSARTWSQSLIPWSSRNQGNGHARQSLQCWCCPGPDFIQQTPRPAFLDAGAWPRSNCESAFFPVVPCRSASPLVPEEQRVLCQTPNLTLCRLC